MRIEILFLLITGFFMANIYSDGKLLRKAISYKKYYKMAGIAVGALFLYAMFKKNPLHAHKLIESSNEYLKYLPVDRNTSTLLHPILDFTKNHAYTSQGSDAIDTEYPIVEMPKVENGYQNRIMNSGKGATKRSVSESKKKFVAHRQGWKCNHCKKVLPASFEVDHVVRLQHGGSNHVDNLVALCRECHGEKTIMENL